MPKKSRSRNTNRQAKRKSTLSENFDKVKMRNDILDLRPAIPRPPTRKVPFGVCKPLPLASLSASERLIVINGVFGFSEEGCDVWRSLALYALTCGDVNAPFRQSGDAMHRQRKQEQTAHRKRHNPRTKEENT